MCGIAGVINYEKINLNKLTERLHHRGPDAQSIYTENDVALIHTRLAIQDIHNGIQPFHYLHYTIIFNGEIYNHQELRKRLKEFDFKTNSDTETFLYLFIKYKYQMFDLIDGMFAVCIYDRSNHTITLARDRAGKKPLYYFKNKNIFAFASELNALKTIDELTVNPDAINCFLRAGLIWQPYTAYQNTHKLPAGTYLVLNIKKLSYQISHHFHLLQQYTDTDKNSHFQQNLETLENNLRRSVSDRMTASDVEVGVFLSGGIDSNLIAALAAQEKAQIKTFTVKFNGLYNESSLARLTANRYRTDHVELNISSDLKNDIEKIILSYGEPFMDSSAIPSYYVSREAAKYVKVILSGDGADELFAGYRRYVPMAHSLTKYTKPFTPLLSMLPKPQQKKSIYNYLHRLLVMSKKNSLDFYLSATTDIFEDILPIENNSIITNLNQFIQNVFAHPQLSPLNKMLYADFSVILFCDLLVKMDIASMANSLEVRSPFLSKYLLEFAPTLPDSHKINKLKTKYILRKLAEKHLPSELINQPKRGFEVPLKNWLDHDLRENIFDRLKPGCYSEQYIKSDFIQNLLYKKINVAPEKRAKMIWSLYCLEVWYQNEANNCDYR